MDRPRTFPAYLGNLAVALDQLGNAIFGGNAHGTLSARAWEGLVKKKTWACVLCRFLDIFEKDHCHKAMVREAFVITAFSAAETALCKEEGTT